MSAKSFTVDVNPAVLTWARESAGYSVEEAALRCGKPAELLLAWETGRRRPNWTVLNKLAAIYKRPVASLLLPAPPHDAPPPPDFRTLPDGKGQFSPRTLFAIRTARWLVRKATELQEQLKTEMRFVEPGIDLSSDPEKTASAVREILGVTVEEQAAFGDLWKALKRWRTAIEAQHVFVFQFKMPVADARGFSVIENERPAIVLNQSDAASARIFTLFHEYAHLLLRRPGVCNPEFHVGESSQRIETFCNRFAAALLLPREEIQERLPNSPSDDTFRTLARRYFVSRYVVLGRLHDLGAVSAQTYRQLSQGWQRQDEAAAARPQGGGGLKAPARCLLQRGKPFVSLVVEAAKRELITVSEATTYLGTKVKDFRQLAKGA